MSRVDCVILNYNDFATTMKLVNRIRSYESLYRIILVDNDSTNDSMTHFEQYLDDDKIVVMCASANRGYGAGNNLGLEYAFVEDGADMAIVANPDVQFSEQTVKKLARLIEQHPSIGAVAAQMEDIHGRRQGNAFRLHTFVGELLAMGPVSMRLFHKLLQYPVTYFDENRQVMVDCVHGSMLMISAEAFGETGGYDEGIFLYQEEAVLGQRLRSAGYETVLDTSVTYRHEHSTTISQTYRSMADRQRLRNESVLYYMRHYLHIHAAQEQIARLWFGIIMLELRLVKGGK